MSEFSNRIAAQRAILATVNAGIWAEELFGLSSKAIERWAMSNRLDPASRLLDLVTEASKQLLFLANRSQEQISDEYVRTSASIATLHEEIRGEIETR
jgi:hypothetical protein